MFSRWKRIDILIGILFILTNISYLFSRESLFPVLLWALIIVAVFRLFQIIRQKLFWKIRNRLIFSGLFFIVTPIFFLLIFFFIIINIIIAQYGINIIDNIMNTQLNQLEMVVTRFLDFQNPDKMIMEINRSLKFNPEHLNVVFFEKKDKKFVSFFKYPKDFDEKKLIIKKFSGYFTLNNKLYHGVLKQKDNYAVMISLKQSQKFLDELSTISDFRIKFREPEVIQPKSDVETALDSTPEDEETFFAFPWLFRYKYLDFNTIRDSKPVEKQSFFGLLIDYEKIFNKIKGVNPGLLKGDLKKILYFLIGLFGTFIIVSFFIGFRIIRVITKSINQITHGTQKIRKGDFSFRIKIKSGDQLHYLAESFNEMASGINRLLIDEKEKHRLEEELRIARSIQLKLLPSEVFSSKEFELSAVNIPATEIAGDYFDYFYKKGDYLSILVADVSGKGASAAFYMAELKGLLNYLQKSQMSPASLISECHYSLSTSLDKATFITISLAKFIIPQNKFILTRAGHTQAIFYSAKDKKCIELYPEGVAIGLTNFTKEKLEEIEVKYQKDDILFLFSDGLSEIMNEEDEILDIGNLKTIVEENCTLSTEEIKQKILDFSIQFSKDNINRDDLTFILLKVK